MEWWVLENPNLIIFRDGCKVWDPVMVPAGVASGSTGKMVLWSA